MNKYYGRIFAIVSLLTIITLASACKDIPVIQSSDGISSQPDASTSSIGSDPIDSSEAASDDKDVIVTFKDPAIEYSVRSLLLREKGDIRLSDLENIESIFIGGAESLDDLINFPALKVLDLENNMQYDPNFNTFTDIFILSDLNQLEELNLSGNSQITDFSPISKLVNLRSLDLFSCDITDIGFLTELKNIQELSLSNIEIENLNVLSALTSLEILYLTESDLLDASVLGELINIRELWIPNNKIDNIDFVCRLTFLQKLIISENKISDISCLKNLHDLATLYADDNMITDLSSLEELTNLRFLSLCRNSITDLNPIRNMNQMVVLYLDGNQITDYSPTKGYYDSLIDKDFTID